MEEYINNLILLHPAWVYTAAFLIAYIENIFPPFPSDVILVAAGYLSATDKVDFFTVLFLATTGSTLGFMTMYKIGFWFGYKIIEAKKLRFLQLEKIHNVELWFKRYGYFIVVINRFLAGTRAVISFFTGISNLSFWKTTILATVSSFLWNLILLAAGNALGKNWKMIIEYLDTYWIVVTVISIIIIIFIILKNYFNKNQKQINS